MTRVATMEECPPELRHLDYPEYGGMLTFRSGEDTRDAHCPVCDWQGLPTIVDGTILSHCPACNPVDEFEFYREALARPAAKVPRNYPCPCGSGVKAKRCACMEYTV